MRWASLWSLLALLAAATTDASTRSSSTRRRRPLLSVIKLTYRIAPGLRPWVQRMFMGSVYNYVTSHAPDAMTFMNYGYASPEATPTLQLDPEDVADRFGIQLYHAVLADTELAGKDVLEVGCGRGGGSHFMAKYLNPQSIVGLDLAAKSVSFCERRHHAIGLSFKQGDAENLPFPSSSFDVVVNVESSHGYPDVNRFLTEVCRVLRPDGRLLLADFRPREQVETLRHQVREAGFSILDEEPITTAVVAALERQSDQTKKTIDTYMPGLAKRFLPNCLQGLYDASAIRGTAQFEKLASGQLQYVRFVAVKINPQV